MTVKCLALCIIVVLTFEVTLGAPTLGEYIVAVDPRNNQPYIPLVRSFSDFFRNNIFDYNRFIAPESSTYSYQQPFDYASKLGNQAFSSVNNGVHSAGALASDTLNGHPYPQPLGYASNVGKQAFSSVSNGLQSAGTLASDAVNGLIHGQQHPNSVQLPDGTHVTLPAQPPLSPLQPSSAQMANTPQTAASATAAAAPPPSSVVAAIPPQAASVSTASTSADSTKPLTAPLLAPPANTASTATATSAT